MMTQLTDAYRVYTHSLRKNVLGLEKYANTRKLVCPRDGRSLEKMLQLKNTSKYIFKLDRVGPELFMVTRSVLGLMMIVQCNVLHSRADPGFEVRVGANGFDNLKTEGGSHIFQIYYDYHNTYIYIYINYDTLQNFKYYDFFIPTSPLYYIVLKNLIWNFFRGGGGGGGARCAPL